MEYLSADHLSPRRTDLPANARHVRTIAAPENTLILVAAEIEAAVLFPEPGRRPASVRVAGVGRGGDAAARAAIEATRPDFVLNVGFAGGLDQTALPGQCFVTSTWVGEYAHTAAPLPPPLRASLAELRATEAVTATVDTSVGDAVAREPLLAAGAQLVEMEGGAWARLAQAMTIPFAAVRVVSDRADNPLPRPRHEILRPDGAVRWGKWARAAAGSSTPWLAGFMALRNAQRDWRAATATLGAVGDRIQAWIEPD